MHIDYSISRRGFVGGIALGAAAWLTPGVFAEELTRTPKQTEGPFYPTKLPLDTDNDLLIINDAITPAVGTVTHLTGRSSAPTGSPTRQHARRDLAVRRQRRLSASRQRQRRNRDTNFQGFGRFMTGSSGEYYFRTIKPVKYPGRTPHIHFKVKKSSKELIMHPVLHQGRTRQRSRRRPARHPRRQAARLGARRFRADQRLTRRRSGGEVRYCAGVHTRRK